MFVDDLNDKMLNAGCVLMYAASLNFYGTSAVFSGES